MAAAADDRVWIGSRHSPTRAANGGYCKFGPQEPPFQTRRHSWPLVADPVRKLVSPARSSKLLKAGKRQW